MANTTLALVNIFIMVTQVLIWGLIIWAIASWLVAFNVVNTYNPVVRAILNPHSPSKSLILLSGSQYFRYKSWC